MLARVSGLGHHTEDFAQDSILKILDGRKASYRELLIDYWREHYGRGGRRLADSLVREDDPRERFADKSACEPLTSMVKDMFLDKLNIFDRIVVVLFYKWGFTHKEIAYAFGVSEDCIAQRWAAFKQKYVKKFTS